MDSPKITIVTASFNSEKTITDTIESILNQTYHNIEYLIIDGGSTDETIEIVKRYENKFQGRLTWISERDNGIYDAWNKALKLYSGEWICFVGSDDIMTLNAVEKYAYVIANNPGVNFVSSKTLLVRSDLTPIRINGKPRSENMNTYNCISHVGCMHHKSLFLRKGAFNTEYKIAGDYDFLLRCADTINPAYLPIVTVTVRDGGISGRNIERVARETLNIKVLNKCKAKWKCVLDYYIAILKYYLRVMVINKLSTVYLKRNL